MKKLLLIVSIFLLYITNTYAINVCENTKYSGSLDYRYSPNTDSILSFNKKAERLYSISKDGIELYEFAINDEYGRPPSERSFDFSPDGQHYFHYLSKDEKAIMVKDGVEGKGYDSILWYGTEFSNNNDLVYIASYEKEGKYKQFFVRNGVEIRGSDDINVNANQVFFSPDGQRTAYMFFDNNAHKYFVVENGIEYEGFYTESFPIIKYNDDSKYFYYLNEKANGKMGLIRNGVEIKESENIMWTVGNNIKYVALKDNGKYGIFEDEKELLEFEVPEDYTLRRGGVAISPDNKNVAFVAKKDGKETLFENGIPGKEYFSVFNLMYSPDSKRLAYTASSMYGGEGDVIVLDGKEYKYNTYIKAIGFSPDSKIFAYDGGGYTIFFNGKPAIELKNAEANYGGFTDGFRFISSDDFYYMYNIRNSGGERVFVRIVCEKNIDTSSLEALEEKLEFTKNNLPSEYVNLINKTIGNLLKFQLREIYEKLEYIYLDKLVYDKNKYAIDYIELAILSKL